MKFNKTVKRVFSILVVAVMCFTLLSFGADALTLDKNGSIALHVADSENKTPMEGARFRLYMFAAAYEKGNGVGYDYVIPYDDCNMDMDNLQDAHLAVHLSHFALTHDLPYAEKVSDASGDIVFDGLKPGVYLVLATEILENYYLPSPFVINIPIYNNDSNKWEYNIIATPKMRICGSGMNGESTYLSVKKIWDTDEEVPEKITVSLLRNLKEVERVELSEKNNWYYRWDNLGMEYTWNVVESVVPEGYRVSYSSTDKTITITNTKDVDDGETTNPETTTKPDELIDTGQLNWPIPVFSIAGLILFSIGWAMLNLSKKDEEKV